MPTVADPGRSGGCPVRSPYSRDGFEERVLPMSPAAGRTAFLACLLAPWGFLAAQEPRFALEFVSVSPETFQGVSSSTINPFEVSAAVRPEGLTGPAGPTGWSMGVRHDLLLELLQVTVDGTNAGDLLDLRSGFLRLETINPAANSGLVGFNISSLNVLPITVEVNWFEISQP